jgi:hypothetical protein
LAIQAVHDFASTKSHHDADTAIFAVGQTLELAERAQAEWKRLYDEATPLATAPKLLTARRLSLIQGCNSDGAA